MAVRLDKVACIGFPPLWTPAPNAFGASRRIQRQVAKWLLPIAMQATQGIVLAPQGPNMAHGVECGYLQRSKTPCYNITPPAKALAISVPCVCATANSFSRANSTALMQ